MYVWLYVCVYFSWYDTIVSKEISSGNSQSFRAIGNLLEHLSLLKDTDAFEPYELHRFIYIHTYIHTFIHTYIRTYIHIFFIKHIRIIFWHVPLLLFPREIRRYLQTLRGKIPLTTASTILNLLDAIARDEHENENEDDGESIDKDPNNRIMKSDIGNQKNNAFRKESSIHEMTTPDRI